MEIKWIDFLITNETVGVESIGVGNSIEVLMEKYRQIQKSLWIYLRASKV